jgi:hypothetical protein
MPMDKPDAAGIAMIKKRLMEDPNTAKIAEKLGMTFESYLELVMKYVNNPNMDAMVDIVSDEDLRAAGTEPPDIKKAAAWFSERVEARTMTTRSKFADPNSQRERVTGKIPLAPAAKAAPDEVRQDLKEELDRELSTGRGKKI